MAVLVWKPFADDAEPPRWRRIRRTPEPVPGQVTVTAFCNGWCPAVNMVAERARRACLEVGDGVCFQEYDTSDPAVLAEWGIADGLFIDGKAVRTGPPPTYEKVLKLISRRARALSRGR